MPLTRRLHDLSPLPAVGRIFLSGFESTYLPAYGVDSVQLTGHEQHWQHDISAVAVAGVRHVRHALRWNLIEAEEGRFDWSETDRQLGRLRDMGIVPIVDLVHHTSYPLWLTGGFGDPKFGAAFVRFAEAVAVRYPWLPAYTLFNEPFATLFLAGHEGIWPPYGTGLTGFVDLLRSVLPAVSEAARCWRELLPAAHHVWVDTAEHHVGSGRHADYAALANDRRYIALDLATGHDLQPDRPFLMKLLAAGGEDLLALRPLSIDVLGLDYYAHSEWLYDDSGSHAPSPRPVGFAAVAQQYAERYGMPMMLTETNIRGLPTDRVSWLRYTLEQYELALARGVELHGYCWFPHIDSSDWDSLLARPGGRVDPVGVLSRDGANTRLRTCFTDTWAAAAAGAAVSDLPAYRWQSPCAEQLAGLTEQTEHWPWQDPPPGEVTPALEAGPRHQADVRPVAPSRRPATPASERRSGAESAVVASLVTASAKTLELRPMRQRNAQPDLIVLSHLRWEWVWQRPQHLVSRLARDRAGTGSRTWFVEEPKYGDVWEPTLDRDEVDGVNRVWLVLPAGPAGPEVANSRHVGFTAAEARCYGDLLARLLAEEGCTVYPDVWLYTPMAMDNGFLGLSGRLIYDVMDDLAAFANAPDGLRLLQRRALTEADIVFTGGRSLHQSVLAQRRRNVHLFPSGVETAHYAAAFELRKPHDTPVAGYVGVIDERLDLSLVAELAALLPKWTILMVGPVAKIDPAALPQAPNLEYPGFVTYAQLPAVMAGFDVALMPFALNEATRAISPTKTLEYLAAGLPVVATRVADVVADYGDVVSLAGDGAEFAAACRNALTEAADHRLHPIVQQREWDTIASRMARLIDASTPWAAAGFVGSVG